MIFSHAFIGFQASVDTPAAYATARFRSSIKFNIWRVTIQISADPACDKHITQSYIVIDEQNMLILIIFFSTFLVS